MGQLLSRQQLPGYPGIPFSEFLTLLRTGQIKEVVFRNDDVLEVLAPVGKRLTQMIQGMRIEWLVVQLVDAKVPFSEGRRQPGRFARGLRAMLVLGVPLVYLFVVYSMLKKLTGEADGDTNYKRQVQLYTKTSTVSWDSIAGIDSALQEVKEVVSFMLKPDLYSRLGARCPRGILLSGPPGCGKTMLAQAAANEAGLNFISCSASDFVEVFVGRGAARVRELFRRAERSAPCILFFDELDALAKSRTGGLQGNDEREQTLNQLLTEMDGFDSCEHGSANSAQKPQKDMKGMVVIIGATNRPDVLDRALVRPGRFDRHVQVHLPSEKGRLAVLEVHVRQRNMPLERPAFLSDIAKNTQGFSGAELAAVLNEAALFAVREQTDVVLCDHLSRGVEKIRQMLPRQLDDFYSS